MAPVCSVCSSPSVPTCFKFSPTERDLVQLFLIPRALGLALPRGHEILERPLYGDEAAPWKVFTDQDPWQFVDDTMKKKIIYVFSRVIAKNGQSKTRTVRTAGCGTWDGKAVGKPIRDAAGNVIGSKRAFTFKPKKEFENEMKGKWIMHEYSLASTREYKDGDVVVCRISNHVEEAMNEDEGSGLDSDDGSNSMEKTSRRKASKRARRGGVSVEKTGNQESGLVVSADLKLNNLEIGVPSRTGSVNVSGDLRLNNQETVVSRRTDAVNGSSDLRLNNQEIVFPRRTELVNGSSDLWLNNQEADFPSRTDLAQQNENQEVPHSAATPEEPQCADKYVRDTPVLRDFFK